MRGAPGNDVRGGLAMNQRERRLKRIDMANTLSPLEQPHVEVRDPAGTHLPLPDQARHLTPRLFHRRAERVRPVKLVQVDALDAEPAKRSLDFFTDRSRPKVALRLFEGPRWIRDHPAFRKDIGTLRGRELVQRMSDDLLGMAEAIDGCGVDPVDATGDRVLDGRD